MEENKVLLEAQDLQQYFPVAGRRGKFVRAVDGVSFAIREGETFGLVGESGCGKSTLARTVIRINKPTGGRIAFDGLEITNLSQKDLKGSGLRQRMQMVFQDPYSSLNSRMTVRDALMEPLIANQIGENDAQREEMAREALGRVNLSPDYIHRYPHEFSGGQRQRICIARALIVKPQMVICDEAISALDVSIQAQVVNMLGDFQQELGLTYLFIAHDLSMVRYVSHRVGVMYLGRLVELCESEEIYSHPLHPYTQGLLRSVPVPDPKLARSRDKEALEGEVPSPIDPPKGCHFHPRCPYAKPVCREAVPPMTDAGSGHMVCCHLFSE
ncbi:MAG: ABC transporter ATP-binding protein [Oscillospiraceae bacterium]|nr:ABC transporter ATP-binding protein [Oscillospiraceae bacterium]